MSSLEPSLLLFLLSGIPFLANFIYLKTQPWQHLLEAPEAHLTSISAVTNLAVYPCPGSLPRAAGFLRVGLLSSRMPHNCGCTAGARPALDQGLCTQEHSSDWTPQKLPVLGEKNVMATQLLKQLCRRQGRDLLQGDAKAWNWGYLGDFPKGRQRNIPGRRAEGGSEGKAGCAGAGLGWLGQPHQPGKGFWPYPESNAKLLKGFKQARERGDEICISKRSLSLLCGEWIRIDKRPFLS